MAVHQVDLFPLGPCGRTYPITRWRTLLEQGARMGALHSKEIVARNVCKLSSAILGRQRINVIFTQSAARRSSIRVLISATM